ncbi:hypothetical protein QWE_05848 [Agrobacterium albertimagni AOL15]|uniref:Uncharacterized protein n=1 Tax=Agrobacterium albertimagni AOL15 TaxID=1156935 RepID=K2Q5U2_9HYPH|nr:hypothetical protein [Agrobacterium albertimagni]EKF60565.1 hypothetical protein QWE_05848 [Agrobacterium albertimagni AOL15]
MDGIATAAANERAKAAATHLRRAGGHSNWVFEIQMALGDILHFADPRRERWELPDTRFTNELFASCFDALAHALRWGTDTERMGKIDREHLGDGFLAAARLVQAFDREDVSLPCSEDDRTRVKILIHHARIAEHRQDMANRRYDRQHGTIDALLETSTEPTYGMFS